ncbi:membrane dipeptidase [Sphingomonas sp. ID1715]|uniref:dipeptidase n=1 Tax=Sphingomonas sp. ID1715 TaxID=1656898 RepID=UPI0014880561|nr:dipeptidase [Sphingomonas sp. ID1715]NNM77238.1 membrane dipeptidase [Sphingomonas sp. ID1715]
MILAALLAAAVVPPSVAALHDRMLVLDTHLDTPVNLGRPGWNFAQGHSFTDDISQVDLPRMKAGGLDGGFFVIYTEQGPLTDEGYAAAKAHAWRREAWIRAMVRQVPDQMELAFTPADARRIAAKGKRVVFQSIENSYPLGPTVAAMKDFYDAGVRLAGPVHNGDNQFADAANRGKRSWGGLSPLGREWVKEANRLGILIDLSHASDETVDQVLELSTAPVILSHSGPRALFDHPRNLDDARIRKIAAKGGVIQVNSVFLAPMDGRPERDAASTRWESLEDASPREAREAGQAWAKLEADKPNNPVTFDRYMESLLYLLKLVGPDHVGIGMDWDGGGGLIGMPDVSGLPRITAALKAAGYSDADIQKVWSGNLLRALGEAQRLAAK